MSVASLWLLSWAVVHVAVLVRVLAVDGKESTSRAAWTLILVFLPGVGVVAYLLFGEPWMPRSIRRKAIGVVRNLLHLARGHALHGSTAIGRVPAQYRASFHVCERLARSGTTDGNTATVAADSNAAIDAMVADFDAARETIHVSFYIWLADNNGLKVADALMRATRRGIPCRVIADGVGSRAFIRSRHWAAMQAAGVRLCVSLDVRYGLAFLLGHRMDLRNHRKIIVVDDRISWCGSQNCADPEFRVKKRYAPWVDIMLRFEGPVAQHSQLLFASDWMIEAGEDLSTQLQAPVAPGAPDGFPAIAFGSGPFSPLGAMASVFISLLYAAHSEVVITTPYFVPDPSLLEAMVCCARRGVDTTLILPARNDSWLVGMISRAHYLALVKAGVRIHEFEGGLLHAKTVVVDRFAVLVGSANMDRRSLDLNFENNLLFASAAVAAEVRARQDAWLAASREVSVKAVRNRSILRRIGDNLATLFGPVM